jgi:ribosomal protein S26
MDPSDPIGVPIGRTIRYNEEVPDGQLRIASGDLAGLRAIGLVTAAQVESAAARLRQRWTPPQARIDALETAARVDISDLARDLRARMRRAASDSPLGFVRPVRCERCGCAVPRTEVLVRSTTYGLVACTACVAVPPSNRVVECGGCGRWMTVGRWDHRRRYCTDACAAWGRRRAERARRAAATSGAGEGAAPRCVHCGTPLGGRRRDARHCSGRCRVAAHRARAATGERG